MLAMVKEGVMKPLKEKRINTAINVWVRCPALVGTAIMLLVQFGIHRNLPLHVLALRIFCVFINYWNGCYFMERVVSNYYVTRSKLQDAQATAKKDDDKVTRDKIARIADSKEIKKDFLVDDVDSHPLPSVPFASRSVRFGALGKAWDWVRKGS